MNRLGRVPGITTLSGGTNPRTLDWTPYR
jgi:hypothetical protein